ncbi:hypothetical protein CYMTET_48406 [Cymbomonas tetramitiformis]|uniref:Uncharacterized protein n=1 Tax=Cymbomonas tetramitiformis TaxID=36881 RepID=A0AAE0BU14_9CHLO|nr:hypothetical protein CYMTET_48406 [Cymbomonas tetramitiformis]
MGGATAGTYYNLSRANQSETTNALAPLEGLDINGFADGGYPFYFDAGVTGARALQLLTMLQQSLYMDHQTHAMHVRMLTWNAQRRCLTSIRVEFRRAVGSGAFRALAYITPYSFVYMDDQWTTMAIWYTLWLLLLYLIFFREFLSQRGVVVATSAQRRLQGGEAAKLECTGEVVTLRGGDDFAGVWLYS